MKPTMIIVEGLHDCDVLNKIYPEVRVVSVGGSAVNKESVDFLKSVEDMYEFIIFCDPDHAGERIRHILSEIFPKAQHAFLPQLKAKAKSGRKIGVEHATSDDIKKALDARIVISPDASDLTTSFLFDVGLIGRPESRIMREQLSKKLNLGNPNAKTLLKRLKWLGLNQDSLLEVIDEYTT